jgi:hypothetical protein
VITSSLSCLAAPILLVIKRFDLNIFFNGFMIQNIEDR